MLNNPALRCDNNLLCRHCSEDSDAISGRIKEKKLFEKGEFIPQPTARELSLEEREIKPYLIFTITDDDGNVIRKLYKSASKGVGRITWNFTYAGYQPVRATEKFNPVSEGERTRQMGWRRHLSHAGQILRLNGHVCQGRG